jgi:hypothetical protein
MSVLEPGSHVQTKFFDVLSLLHIHLHSTSCLQSSLAYFSRSRKGGGD